MTAPDGYDWQQIGSDLTMRGFAPLPKLIPVRSCSSVAAMFDDDHRFRSHIHMRRHGFGEGEYKYFGYPLPDPIAGLRTTLYPHLAPIANDWADKLTGEQPFPDTHRAFLKICHDAGQSRPTPLLLRYEAGDYNRLHQDLYGEIHFPIQIVVLLDRPGTDFEGGEFVMTEQKPRSQSRAHVIPMAQGDAVAFAVNDRPAQGARGYYRLKTRHGVSDIRRGFRRTLGIIFHDAA